MKQFKKILLLIPALAILVMTFSVTQTAAQSLAQQLVGKILLQVEDHGEAWYVHPDNMQRYYLRDGEAAYNLMRFFSLGITDVDLALIPTVADTTEMLSATSICSSNSFANMLSGQILLQVQQNGEAWYVDTNKCRSIYMKDGAAAYDIMRFLGLGITTKDLQGIPTAPDSAIPPNGNPSTPVPTPTPTPTPAPLSGDKLALFNSINAERALAGRMPLSNHSLVEIAAQNQADDMTARQYFDSTTPEGKQFTEWVKEQGYYPFNITENFSQSNAGASKLVSNWFLESTASYNNVIDPEVTEVGIGIGSLDGIPLYVVIFTTSAADHLFDEQPNAADLGTIRLEMLGLLNNERSAAGLSLLTSNTLLDNASQAHTDDMLSRSFYSHDTPEGKTPHQRITEAGYKGMKTAENIAKGQFSAKEVMVGWMLSQGHRGNILDPDFTEVGFGFSFGINNNGYEVIWSQNFGLPF